MRDLFNNIRSKLSQLPGLDQTQKASLEDASSSSTPSSEKSDPKTSDPKTHEEHTSGFAAGSRLAAFLFFPMSIFGAINYDDYTNNVASIQLTELAQQVAVTALKPEHLLKNGLDPAKNTSVEKAVKALFMQSVPDGVTITALNVRTINDDKGLRAIVDYEALVDNFVGLHDNHLINTVQVKLGKALAEGTDIYILVDTSQSMAAGADVETQKKMAADPEMRNCMFACHQALETSQTYVDTIDVARKKNYPLRLDLVKASVRNLIKSATDLKGDEDSDLRIGIYSFASDFKEVARPSIDLLSVNKSVDQLAISPFNNGTNLQFALTKLQENIEANARPNRKAYVVLLSDGVSDSGEVVQTSVTPTNPLGHKFQISPNGTYNSASCWDNAPSADQLSNSNAAKYTLPNGKAKANRPCVADPSAKDHMGHEMMALMSLDPQWCKPIKDKGYSLATIYTSYAKLPVPSQSKKNDWTRNEWRYPFVTDYLAPELTQKMQACANSPSDAYVVDDASSMNVAMRSIFDKWMTNSRPQLLN
jgi:hypothetical protein